MSFKKVLAAVSLIFTISALLFTACGPSIRRTYQSDMAFERCFDLDYDPNAPGAHKSECWRAWLEGQIYNQPDDKIRYAEVRRMEIAQGISVPGPQGRPGEFFKRPRLLVDPSKAPPPADAGVDSGTANDAGPHL